MELEWDQRGLLPAVAQDATSGRLLMVAWMNREAWALTHETGLAHFYSRSRQQIWQKGETSGNTLAIREIRIDCDADTILLRVDPAGPACHTGRTSCFYRPVTTGRPPTVAVDDDASDGATLAEGVVVGADDDGPPIPSAAVCDELIRILRARRDAATAETSYTRSLLDGGFSRIAAKLAEEQAELTAELPEGPDSAVIHESADLIFHLLVALVARDIDIAQVWNELARRFGTSGHDEKEQRTSK